MRRRVQLSLAGAVLLIPALALANYAPDAPRGGGRAVPELNARVAGTALILVLGGVAVLLGRRKQNA